MIYYNVTVKMDKDIEQEWLQWMKTKHIPDVMQTGDFTASRICKLLEQPDEDEEATYVIQYTCATLHKYNHYIMHYAEALRDEHNKKFKEKFVAFRTIMEEV